MKLSIFVLPALALGAKFGRRSNQEIAEIDDIEELTRSSRDLTGWNRNINHGHQLATRNRSNQTVPGLASRIDFMMLQGTFTRAEFLQALAQIKKRRRMDALRKLGY